VITQTAQRLYARAGCFLQFLRGSPATSVTRSQRAPRACAWDQTRFARGCRNPVANVRHCEERSDEAIHAHRNCEHAHSGDGTERTRAIMAMTTIRADVPYARGFRIKSGMTTRAPAPPSVTRGQRPQGARAGIPQTEVSMLLSKAGVKQERI
jgi:hypothetical protein